MRHAGIAATVGLLLTTGCASYPPQSQSSAEVDPATRNLVAFRIQYWDYPDRAVLVEGRFGVLLVWNDRERHFRLFDNGRKVVAATRSWDDFMRQVRDWPDDIEVQRFNTCCVPFNYAMPEAAGLEFDRTATAKGWTWRIDPADNLACTIVCTCESRRITFPS